MKVHEYQAKDILSRVGVPVPKGGVAKTPEEALELAEGLGGRAVVKAQVHAGGRGKAGGIKVVSTAEEAKQAAASMLGASLVTPQTGPDGVPVGRVIVEEMLQVERELYVGIVIDAGEGSPVVMVSEAGGMDIEEVADRSPEKIVRVAIDPMLGMQPYQGRKLAYSLNLGPKLVRPVSELFGKLYTLLESYDCSLIEINPLVVTTDDRVLAADAKLSFDDDALFRHLDIQQLHDPEQEDPLEARARGFGVSYVKLSGNVGCMVNGAGLAMATMDVAKAAGAAPANFLDVGGGADEEKVARAMDIILADPSVDRVLINIFGGILRCDIVARGILIAAERAPQALRPMVARLLGTNAEQARELLSQSSLDVTLVEDFAEVAEAIKAAA